MEFQVGQQVIYPNHGVGKIENIERKQIGTDALAMYQLRLFFNNTTILVPVKNAVEIGLRKPVTAYECDTIIKALSEDCSDIPSDWKVRSKIYSDILRRGLLPEVADVFKKLTYLSRTKPLSFREQRLLEKARYLVISELAAVCQNTECEVEARVFAAIDQACAKQNEFAGSDGKMALTATVH